MKALKKRVFFLPLMVRLWTDTISIDRRREVNKMKFFFTFFWTFLLVQMATYVVSSMNGSPFNFVIGSIVAVAVTLLLFIITSIIPNEEVQH